MSVSADGATVTRVAQRHEITRQKIYARRHDKKKQALWSLDDGRIFVPFVIPAHGVPAIAYTPTIVAPMAVELRPRNGLSLHFDS